MQRDQTARTEEIAEAIRDLFAPEDDYVLVIGDNSIFGCDGIVGLRLLVNHLFDEVYRDEPSVERHLMGSQERPAEDASARRHKLQQGLKELAQRSDVDYALCYHIRATPSWDMAWSQALTCKGAIRWLCWVLKADLEQPLDLFV